MKLKVCIVIDNIENCGKINWTELNQLCFVKLALAEKKSSQLVLANKHGHFSKKKWF